MLLGAAAADWVQVVSIVTQEEETGRNLPAWHPSKELLDLSADNRDATGGFCPKVVFILTFLFTAVGHDASQ